MLLTAWRCLVNYYWHFSIAGHMRRLFERCVGRVPGAQLAAEKSGVSDCSVGHGKFPESMKIVRLSSGRTDRERPDAFCSEMNNTVLVLHPTFHLNTAFMQHDHRIEAVDVWHH